LASYRKAIVLAGSLALLATAVRAAPVVVGDTDFDLADYDVVEIETGDLSPLPQPDGFGRVTVTREIGGSSGTADDAFARVEMEGYDTTGSTGYGQLNALLLWKQPVDPATAGGFVSLTYRETTILFAGGGQGHATGPVIKQGDDVYIRTASFTPETAWSPKLASPIAPGEFSHLVGSGPSAPDLSATGAPFHVGVFRATSGPAPSAGGIRTGGIDDWVVVLSPACTTSPDCATDSATCTNESCDAGLCTTKSLPCGDDEPCTTDLCDFHGGGCVAKPVPDGTPCTDSDRCNGEETCQAGACTAGTPLVCADDDLCTTDACDPVFGCQSDRAPTYAVAFEKLEELVQRLKSPVCDGSPLVKKLRKKLTKKIAKVRKRVKRAGRTNDPIREQDLVYGTGPLFLAARELLQAAVGAGQVSPECAAIIGDFLTEAQACVYSLIPLQ